MQKMMKYGYILILLTAFFLSCEKEISPEQADNFIKFYGNYQMDQAGDVEVLGNGGYAICGTETSESLGKRMVLIVTDEFGNVQSGFPRYYAEEGLETGGSSLIALQDGGGGFVLSGFVEKMVEGSQEVQKDIFVVRATAAGDTSWQRSYGSFEDELVLHSVERIGSGYMLAGYQVKDGKSDIMVMGVTEEGDSIRLGLNYNNPYAENSAATYLLKAGDMYLCACTYDKVNGEGTGIQVLTFDNDLSPLAKNLSGEYNEYGMCILEEGSGRYLVLGNRENVSGGNEMLLYGIETNGLLITNASLNATISEANADLIGERMIRTASRDLAITGTRRAGNNDEILLQFVSSSYQVGAGLTFGATGSQTGKDIELTSDGGYVVLGTSSSGGNSIISLLKTNKSGDL
ncbi:MAG: hypothetical protein U9R49_08370 [Bacteroidota bacterium]|nr:hypothetical protein [Bacteroidota bacterium]